MLFFILFKRLRINHSIIMTGESGAGKSENAKNVVRYFANVCGTIDDTYVERKILACSPILESFGNAKTKRNENSSRFGKYLKIDFENQQRISGASISTYLLEKSRVVIQGENESNYHIFYQLCSQRFTDELKELYLSNLKNYSYNLKLICYK